MKAKIILFLQAAALALAVGWAFAPARNGGWVWDDAAEVAKNPVLRDPAALRKIWLAPTEADYFPLKSTVQAVEWRLWQDHPRNYHLVGIGLHLLSALLFWRLLRRLGVNALGAYLGAFIFAVHPMTAESVAWIAELKNTLALPWLLLAMLCWEGRARSRACGSAPYLGALLCFTASLFCKTSGVMFPFVLLLYAWWRRGRIGRRDLAATAPFFAVSLVLGLVTLWFQQHHAIRGADLASGGALARSLGAGSALAFYLAKFAVPAALMPIYPRWEVISPLPWFALAAVAAWLGAVRGGWARAALFGVGCFALNLAPVLGIFPMAYLRISWVADHFAYLPLLGLAGLAGTGLAVLIERETKPRTARGWSALVLTGLLVGGWAVRTHRQAGFFRNDESFWTEAARRNPRAWLARSNRGLIFAASGRWAQAAEESRAVIALRPEYPEGHNNLGNALAAQGELPTAIAEYREALRLQPDYLDARGNLGGALAQSGQWGEAIAEYEAVLRRRSDDARVQGYLARALERTGRPAEALAQWERAVRLDPADADKQYRLANALGNAGRLPEALAHYAEALRLNPGFAEARANFGLALAGLRRNAEAIAQLEQALRLRPDYPEAEAYLGLALAQSGRPAEAVTHYRRALERDPGNAEVRYRLREALRAAGRSP